MRGPGGGRPRKREAVLCAGAERPPVATEDSAVALEGTAGARAEPLRTDPLPFPRRPPAPQAGSLELADSLGLGFCATWLTSCSLEPLGPASYVSLPSPCSSKPQT